MTSHPVPSYRQLLRTLGFSPRYTGYRLLTDAIEQYRLNPRQCITKELYPYLARTYRYQSPSGVERAIRYTIQQTWARRRGPEWEALFPYAQKAPTNLDFIAVLAEELE